MLLVTGFGYITKNGKITDKFELEPGEHSGFSEDAVITEVLNKEALDLIVLDRSEEDIAAEQRIILRQQRVESGKAKLESLGLTVEEIQEIFGV